MLSWAVILFFVLGTCIPLLWNRLAATPDQGQQLTLSQQQQQEQLQQQQQLQYRPLHRAEQQLGYRCS
jgi:hypothetical protein